MPPLVAAAASAHSAEARRRYLRANRKSGQTYLWAFFAGVLSVVALAGIWIVLFRLVKMQPNMLADVSSYPQMTVALMILMGSLVSPFMEEAGFRGYFQVALEREFRTPLAIVISSVVFALAHGPTQGFLWPKLLFYFFVGIAFGATAYVTDSTLPAIYSLRGPSYLLHPDLATRCRAPVGFGEWD